MRGSRARLVRTPQAEKHISALPESSRVTTNRCTEGENDEAVMESRRTKQGEDKRADISSWQMYLCCEEPAL